MEKKGDDSNLCSNNWDSLSDLPMEMEFMKNLTNLDMVDENSSQNLCNDELVSISTDPSSNLVPAVDMGADLLATNDQVQAGHNDHLRSVEAQLVMPMANMENTFPATVLGGNHEQHGSVPSPSNIITVLDMHPSTVMVPSGENVESVFFSYTKYGYEISSYSLNNEAGDSQDIENQQDDWYLSYMPLPNEQIHFPHLENHILPTEPPVLDDSIAQAETSIMVSNNTITDQSNIPSIGSSTSEPFKCSVCKEEFPSHRSLTGHMSKHARDNLHKVFPDRKRRRC
ncbi:hypothetical protein FRX31_015863 [Thalictrum thalictroides]|uniref:C2H2-type domain-containing protein n=1 Tax=Thalictrum thalictroides TaxID=46969 RepID=A0A7J6WDV4_THATH|nr:hypothetical protein FRX31_015863 [Thalictrum thalictroides]